MKNTLKENSVKIRLAIVLLLPLVVGCEKKEPNTEPQQGRTSAQVKPGKLVILSAVVPELLPTFSASELELMTPGHRQMVNVLREIAIQSNNENSYTGSRDARRLRAMLAMVPENPQTPEVMLQLHRNLAEVESHLGHVRESIKHFHNAIDIAQRQYGMTSPELLFQLGVVYLRLGETENCCQRASPNSCILPIQGDAIHTKREGSRQARQVFLRILENVPKNSELYYRSLWLLNIAAMTIGEYPGGVPNEYLIPGNAFEPAADFPRFPNVAQEMGVNEFSSSGGAIGDDFDNDGSTDLIVSSWNSAEQIRFLHNNQDGTFTDRTEAAGLKGILGGLNLIHADYNNDGFHDFLVLRGGWLGQGGQHPNSLLQNNGDGTFTDVTIESGLADANWPTQTATWDDFDSDGLLDLFVGNEMMPSQLYINQGDETFVDVAKSAGTTNDRFSKGAVAGDFNADGRPDIYVSNLGDDNRLYQNNGNGTFTDIAKRLDVHGPQTSFPCWFWDYDNDGHLDIYVSAYTATIDQVAKNYLGLPLDIELNRLYKSNGSGGFSEVAKSVGLTLPTAPMGANFGDLDNDGFLDFYLGTGNTSYTDIMPNLMFRNRGGAFFEDVTIAGRFGHLQKGHGIVFADFDQDGDQDVFEQMGGAFPGDRYYDALYQNPGNDNHWISFRLHGRTANRNAIGARVHVVVVEAGKSRSIFRWVNSGGSFGAKPFLQEIGLGASESVESVHVRWPGRKDEQTLSRMMMDRHYDIVQPQDPVGI